MSVLLDTRAPDVALARRELRRQIARLERAGCAGAAGVGRGPRLLSLGELEAVRDALATGRTSHLPAYEQAEWTFAARERFEAMVAEPRAHKWARVSLAELGQPGCGVYRVKPRLGLIGMLAGWWRVTLSSGCP